MSIAQRDYILRIVEQLGQAIARVTALVAAGKNEQALVEIDQAERELLGSQLPSLSRMDTTSVAVLLHSPDRLRGWALVIAQRAHVLGLLGRAGEACKAAERASGLYRAAQQRGATFSELDETARERLRELLGG